MTVARLHCFGESGHSYKVALALTLTGTPWQPVFVDFFAGETRTPAFRALNEMGECPVYVEGDLVLTQSGSILMHIADRTGQLWGGPGEDREVWRWILWDNHKLSGLVGVTRFLANFVPADKRPEPVIAWHQARLAASFRILDRHLGARDWIVSDAVTAADLSCCSYLYYPEPFGFDRKDWPNIDRWLGNIAALPGWKHPYDMMPGNPSDRA